MRMAEGSEDVVAAQAGGFGQLVMRAGESSKNRQGGGPSKKNSTTAIFWLVGPSFKKKSGGFFDPAISWMTRDIKVNSRFCSLPLVWTPWKSTNILKIFPKCSLVGDDSKPYYKFSDQIIATSHDLTPKGS